MRVFKFDSEAVNFVRASLSQGNTLAHYLLELPIEHGQVVSHLPDILSVEDIQAFESSISLRVGPIMSKEKSRQTALNLILTYLSKPVKRYAIFETLGRASDPSPSLKRLPYFTCKSEAYFFFTGQYSDPQTILDALKYARSYPFVGVLTSLPEKAQDISLSQELPVDILSQLAARTDHILIGVYDEEGYLIWSKSSA